MTMLLTDYVALLLCLTYDYVTNILFFCYFVLLMTMLLTACSFVTMSFKAATMSGSGNKSFK